MGRRLHLKIMTAMAVGWLCLATGMAAAPQSDTASANPAEGGGNRPPVDLPPGPDEPAERPIAVPAPPPAPQKAMPEPRSLPALGLHAEPTLLPPVPALPAPSEPKTPTSAPTPVAVELPKGVLDEAVELAQATEKPKPAASKPQPAAPRLAQAPAPASTPAPAHAAEGNALPGASTEAPGKAAPPATSPAKESDPSFLLPADRLPLGKQSVGLTVDVVAPQVLNINQATVLKVIVKNTGQSEAIGVVVRDELPEALTYLSSQPEAQRIDALLSWTLGTVPAGSERVITVHVKPTKVGSFDHAATVSMLAGGKSRTMVREPKLKVEQSVAATKVLKGQPVHFKIAVSNPGDGPARNVTVQAKLSPGLRHESAEPNAQNLFEQTIEVIGPGERVTLDTLVAETTQRDEQSCLIVAQSPDVVAGSSDARSLCAVTVVEPALSVAVKGPEKRFTEMLAPYEITLENKGTAPARNVRAHVTLPVSGRLHQIPSGARFDPQTRKLSWTRSQLEPGEKVVLPFSVRMGGVGLYSVAAEARADSVALAKDVFQTDVEGLADVNFNIFEKRRVVDVDGETVYTIRIDNAGTKEATQLLVSATLSDNIEPVKTSGPDEKQAQYNAAKHEVVFPVIDRLPPGKTIELGIKVKATQAGVASCRVYLVHQEMTDKIDAVARFTVVPTRR